MKYVFNKSKTSLLTIDQKLTTLYGEKRNVTSSEHSSCLIILWSNRFVLLLFLLGKRRRKKRVQ